MFGIRKPLQVFQDSDYKQRIMLEEMMANTFLPLDSADVPQMLNFSKCDYTVKVFYPRKFEVLRKFYCGSHLNFIESMMSSESWADVTGGKTMSPFQKTFDKKYVMKEVKRTELKMFLEFAPQYFDYLCKAFFHDYPCTLAKIVGVYKIKIVKHTDKITPDFQSH